MTEALEIKCETCDGAGMVYNPVWQEWNAALDRWRAEYPGGIDRIGTADLDHYYREHPMPKAPEEYPCGECEGAGTTPTEFGAAVLSFLGKRVKAESWRW